jgi:hypothetical protein
VKLQELVRLSSPRRRGKSYMPGQRELLGVLPVGSRFKLHRHEPAICGTVERQGAGSVDVKLDGEPVTREIAGKSITFSGARHTSWAQGTVVEVIL